MTTSLGHTNLWRGLTVGLLLPDRAFGAAVDVDKLLVEPDLHYAATPRTSRLLLMPHAGSFSRLTLEWETLPEIGVFTSRSLASEPYEPSELARLETWMRDVAVTLHATRDRIREAAERAVHDAAAGYDTSLPTEAAPSTHVVSAQVGTRVSGPSPDTDMGVVDVLGPRIVDDDPTTDEMVFVQRSAQRTIGRRLTRRHADETATTAYETLDESVSEAELAGWYEQHIFREVLFDDVWQVYVHLVAGLDAPANVVYFGAEPA